MPYNRASKAFQLKESVEYTCSEKDDGKLLVDVLEQHSKYSKSHIKKMMTDGSVFQTFKGSRKPARKARITVKKGDVIECYYDPKLELDENFEFELLHETPNFGIYLKPAGAMTEGTNYGDKSSLIRHVQRQKKYVYLVNRIDREAMGLIVVAYNSKSQNLLQEMWKDGVLKKYQAIVMGKMEGGGTIETKINKKPTLTKFKCIASDGETTNVEIELATERKHQIRFHFNDQGHPVMGDPIYGQHNKNKDGLKLISYALCFKDPHTGKNMSVELEEDKKLF